MQIIRRKAYARAGLVGNPSDGYFGKTISLIVREYFAEIVLYEWDEIELIPSQEDHSRFDSVHDLQRDVALHGYYGGIRLVKATVKRFVDYCDLVGIKLHERKFSLRYQSNVPRQVGMAGSSAIITATLRALIDFYGVKIPLQVLPSLALSVETMELGIAAGLQDRVIQAYEGLVYMDFAQERMTEPAPGFRCGMYEPLDVALLKNVYIAFRADVAEPTESFHNNLRARYEQGEPAVLAAMKTFAQLAADAREALLAGDLNQLSMLMDRNFDTRRSICQLPQEQVKLVEDARSVGASAKFAGSGGAIVGIYRDEAMFERLQQALPDCRVFKPTVASA
jgi:glucuronokinase